MNITMNIECSPEEARRLMGLPDMAPIHDLYLDKLKTMVVDGVTPDMMESIVRAWGPMGEAGMSAWKAMLANMTIVSPKS